MSNGRTEKLDETMGAGETIPIMPAQRATLIQDEVEELARCNEVAESEDSGVEIRNEERSGVKGSLVTEEWMAKMRQTKDKRQRMAHNDELERTMAAFSHK